MGRPKGVWGRFGGSAVAPEGSGGGLRGSRGTLRGSGGGLRGPTGTLKGVWGHPEGARGQRKGPGAELALCVPADASLQAVPVPGAGALLGPAVEAAAVPEQGPRGQAALPAPQGPGQEVTIQKVRDRRGPSWGGGGQGLGAGPRPRAGAVGRGRLNCSLGSLRFRVWLLFNETNELCPQLAFPIFLISRLCRWDLGESSQLPGENLFALLSSGCEPLVGSSVPPVLRAVTSESSVP